MTVGTPVSTIATHEFVVPRSMPITFSIRPSLPSLSGCHTRKSLPSGGLPDSLEHRLDGTILRRLLRSGLELAPRVECKARRQIDVGQRDAKLHVARLEGASTLGEPGGLVQVPPGLHDGVGGMVVRSLVRGPRP